MNFRQIQLKSVVNIKNTNGFFYVHVARGLVIRNYGVRGIADVLFSLTLCAVF